MATDFPIVVKLGGRQRVLERLADRGTPRRLATLRQWVWRRQIPSSIQAILLKVASEEGIEADWVDVEWPAKQTSKAA